MTRCQAFVRRAAGAAIGALLGVAVGLQMVPFLPSRPIIAAAAANGWTTYHLDNARSGNDSAEPALGSIASAWTSVTFDGAVYAEPLVLGTTVYAVTENDTVYALDAASGTVSWSAHLGTPEPSSSLPCGNISPTVGITGTPVIDPTANVLYAVGEIAPNGDYVLWALDLGTHTLKYPEVTVTPPGLSALDEGQRGALALNGGMVDIPFGGRYGDCGAYAGALVGVQASTGTGLVSWATPGRGGIWAPSGVAVDGGGNVYATTGNGTCNPASFDYGNSVVKLSPSSLALIDYFAPSTWNDMSCSDSDLGSIGPAFVGGGVIFQNGKTGDGYMLNSTSLGGIGAQLFTAHVCTGLAADASFGGTAYAAPYIYVPCQNGIYALRQSGYSFSLAWSVSMTAGPPIVAGGAVWVIDTGSATLYALNPTTGAIIWSGGVGSVHHFATPSAGLGRIYVPAGDRLTAVTFNNWVAGYNLGSVPTHWLANQSQTFSVTVTNQGSQTWPSTGTTAVNLDLHFALSAGGYPNNAAWLTSQFFALPSDVAPGQSVTLSVTAMAPSTSGSMVLEAEMVKLQQFWFQQWASTAVTVSAGTWSATYDLSAVPRSWAAGQTQSFSVTVTNAGNQSWLATGSTAVELDLHFASAPGGYPQNGAWLTSQFFALPGDVAPGRSATVPVTATAPSTSAAIVLEAEMVKLQQFWFIEWAPAAVTVGGSVWAATYDVSGIPRTWTPGQTQTFTVKVTNSGSVTWPAGGSVPVNLNLHFATAPGGYPNSAAWLTSQFYALSSDVAPGQTALLSVSATAPAGGAAVLEAEMVRLTQFWFVEWDPVPASAAALWSASYDVSGVPRTWIGGQSQSFSLTVTNSGNQAWPSTGTTAVNLNLHFATMAGGYPRNAAWLTSQFFALPGDVAPGQSVSVPVTVTAPATSAAVVLEAEMVKLAQFWFLEWGPAGVAVGSPVWATTYDLSAVPRSWSAGQSQTFTVTVTNTGNQSWPSTGSYAVNLDLHFATAPGGYPKNAAWLTSQFYALPGDLAPGQSATLTVTAQAPAGGEPQVLEAEMVRLGQFWFIEWAPLALS